MVKQPLLSVIVPVYNTVEYLPRCINSIINQTYRNLEIILVDDGSTDGSEEICDKYAKKDGRIKNLHQTNGGESRARNSGLRMASGDYIAFVDCDDWLDSEMYTTLIKLALESGASISACSWYKEDELGTHAIRNKGTVKTGAFDRQQFIYYLYHRDEYRGFSYMWDKIYRRELFFAEEGENLYFDTTLTLGGDVLMLGELALRADKVIYIDRPFYHYRFREDSGCHSNNVAIRLDWVRSYEILLERFEETGVDDNIIEYVKRFLVYHAANTSELAWSLHDNDAYMKCYSWINKYYDVYKRTNCEHPERVEWLDDIMKKKDRINEME